MVKIEFNPAYENARLVLNLVSTLIEAEDTAEELRASVKVSLDCCYLGAGFRLDSSIQQRVVYILSNANTPASTCQVVFSTNIDGSIQFGLEMVEFEDSAGCYARSRAAEQITNWLLGRKRIHWPAHTLRRSETKDNDEEANN